ncbi:hypothetical protein ANCDUO_01246 [Ancylostoma duodenale]|uniref:Uncharacterized protein n=1 Tax=Ancylostoma duodenale TaxID=51022 RepID=A0A0C2HFQ9_9BILA|nr:hypothetical protein ANCDUO_01246 [Ancylostoma duodenale]
MIFFYSTKYFMEASHPEPPVDNAPPPELPNLSAAERQQLVRRSGQDPARRKRTRHLITRGLDSRFRSDGSASC